MNLSWPAEKPVSTTTRRLVGWATVICFGATGGFAYLAIGQGGYAAGAVVFLGLAFAAALALRRAHNRTQQDANDLRHTVAWDLELAEQLPLAWDEIDALPDEDWTQRQKASLRREVAAVARLVVASPHVRARVFADPHGALKHLILRPFPLPWPGRWFAARGRRGRAREIGLLAVADMLPQRRQELVAAVNADAVYEAFFRPAIRRSERSFGATYWLSIVTFIVGVALIVAGVWLGFEEDTAGTAGTDGEDNWITAAVFGGAGAVATLGSVLTVAHRGITGANIVHAGIRVVLTGFATQVGYLRAAADAPPTHSATSNPRHWWFRELARGQLSAKASQAIAKAAPDVATSIDVASRNAVAQLVDLLKAERGVPEGEDENDGKGKDTATPPQQKASQPEPR